MRKLTDEDNDEMLRLQTLLQIHFVDTLSITEEMQNFLTIKGAKKHYLTMYIDVFLLTAPHI